MPSPVNWAACSLANTMSPFSASTNIDSAGILHQRPVSLFRRPEFFGLFRDPLLQFHVHLAQFDLHLLVLDGRGDDARKRREKVYFFIGKILRLAV